ncbi:Cap64 protein [Ephemerocybe angulata]|uniref:Cap64 protein n=1 Tax=Ephemerocybe angulata TaxID=980116 RepID=A0A8H6HG08_9AGAR|nr:Cap64 protein [Tulosesus angulatus]
MQRRQTRGQAYITPPSHHKMGSDLDKSPRRRLGLSNRIWLILLGLVAVVAVTHFIVLPSSNTLPNAPTYSNANLAAKNYFNVTDLGPNPFEFCPSYGPGDELGDKYGASVLSSSRLNVGSGARVQRVLNKALAGQPVTISVLGGSISACHGAGDDPISPRCYPSKFFQWWNTVFPHPATELTNGAMRKTNSGYFGYCNSHHLPDITDLVIIELDTEDSPEKEMMEYFETLVRSILIRPDQPAVVLLGHFSPQIHQSYGFAGPDHWHNLVAQFYDVPHITIKPTLFPQYMEDPASINKYFVDPVLANPSGHDLLSEMLVAYFQSQICVAWDVARGASYDAVPAHKPGEKGSGDAHGLFGGVGQRKGVPEPGGEKKDDAKTDDKDEVEGVAGERKKIKGLPMIQQYRVPSARINTRPNSGRKFEEISPFCVSANDLINPLPPSLFYGSGWYAHHPSTSGGGSSLTTTAHYWYSTLPTSRLRIPMQVGAGDIAIYYLKEPVSKIGEGSSVECWVDDNYAGAKIVENAADIGEPTPALAIIDQFVSRGSHFVECQLMGEEGQGVHAFKLIGVFST